VRVAQVVCTYPPYRGGIGNVAAEYAARLSTYGCAVEVFTPDYGDGAPAMPGVHRLPARWRSGLCAVLPRLAGDLLARFDLIHLHFPFYGAAQFVAWRRWRHAHPRLVLTYHMDAHAPGWRGAVFAAHRRTLLPWIVRRADAILVASRDYAAHSALGRLPDVAARIEEHPFGVDAVRFAPRDALEGRRRLGLADAPTVTFVGGLDRPHAFKGVAVLLRAAAQLPPGVQLALVGAGNLRPEYERQAAALGVAARFLGALSDADLPCAYAAADVVAFPSTSPAEAYGLVALEAAASARAVVASALPGVRSVVRDGETGLLVPPGDAAALAGGLRRLLDDPARRQALATAARRRVEAERTWDHAVARLHATYRRLLAGETTTLPSA
jgi:glycosyltransferase involved in cell wall biosynthesis